jgi:hypothetical protein
VALRDLSLAHLEDLRARLKIDRHLGLKTVRNVIDGSLRAVVRDARKTGVEAGFPFADFEWPRRVVLGLNPLPKRSGIDCLSISCVSARGWADISARTASESTSPMTRFS